MSGIHIAWEEALGFKPTFLDDRDERPHLPYLHPPITAGRAGFCDGPPEAHLMAVVDKPSG